MKRSDFIKILAENEVVFFRHGSEHDRACCKTRLVLHRLLQFFALRATKLRFSAVAVAKLKFCNSLDIYQNVKTGKKVTVPRHSEIDNKLVKKILSQTKNRG